MNRGWPRPPLLHWPLTLPFVGLLALLLLMLAVALQVGILEYVYRKLGLDQGWVLGVLAISILGSGINVPIARLRSRRPLWPAQVVSVFGLRYVVPPVWIPQVTVITVNVGGAIVPTALAAYLVVHDHLGTGTILATAVVALGVYLVARPVQGLGIVVPGLLPPLLAAAMAFLVGDSPIPAVAYVAGVIGSMLGADLLHLPRLRDLGAPMASIGGAGTFDGIFLSGIVAVLIASL
ncbi:MAG TPA: DUF1614 domain-containing protein [Candidatus Dormibacteraeota bacterium]|nr:DUF1614 domain-containing protein [Candidatus Dormibacteraeota bacterium]